MTKRFESNKDLQREKNAIDAFLGLFNLSANKLGPHDIDYEIFNNVGDREIMVYYSEQENLKWKTISSKEKH